MVSWFADGNVSGFDPAIEQRRLDYYLLTTGAMVDAQVITRIHHNLVQFTTYADNLTAIARLNYSPGDISTASGSGRNLTASMYLVAADQVPSVPTQTDIVAAPTAVVYRATSSASSNGEHTLVIPGPRPSVLQPGVKYWILVCPTSVPGMASPANAGNDQPFGNLATLGRGISIWTNRAPSKPALTAPISGLSVGSGTVLNLSFSAPDADATGSTTKAARDIAGLQVQYSPRPTASDPAPAWLDLPIADGGGSLGAAWYIDGASPNGSALALWQNGTIPLSCGAVTPNAAYLPGGDWRIRIRTFDYGHPYPNVVKPLGGTSSAISVDQMAVANASPWSEATNVYVAEQCPPPIPLSPVNNIAVVQGQPVTFNWQFRSTTTPPLQQVARTLQVRPVGASSWTTLVSGASSSTTHVEPSYFSTGVNYEWRVSVTDSGTPSDTSDYSLPARFWMVPVPGSGAVQPLPSQTIDAATLGCGEHRVFVYLRGGVHRIGEITGFSKLAWSRLRDDISDAEVRVDSWGPDCGYLLSMLQCWAYELVVFRDNGYTTERVWEGPITKLTYEQNAVTISARDVMVYAYRRIIKERMSDSGAGDTVVSRARRVLQNTLAADDPNVLAYLTPLNSETDARQYRTTPAYGRTAYEEIDDMASNAGLDYTTVGRSIILWGTKNRIGTLPEFRDEDLGAAPIVSEYGMSMANFYAVSDGNGIAGSANRLDENGEDPTYGLVEMLSSSWASNAEGDTGTYTQEGLATIIESFTKAAERSIANRYPPPVVVRVSDNTTLNPGIPISIQHLVPGVVVPLRSSGTLRTVRANQKVDAVRVTDEGGKETIAITLSPYNYDDADPLLPEE